MNRENAETGTRRGRGRFFTRLFSVFFILMVAAVSVFFFLRRDILAYEDRYGYLGVFALTFLCNATVFAPAPSLLVAVAAAQTLQPVAVILLSAAGTTAGEMVGYLSGFAGKSLSETGGVGPGTPEAEEEGWKKAVTGWISRRGAFAVFLFAFLPLPLFDLAGVASGYSRMKWPRFLVACFLGKLLKMAFYVFASVSLKDTLLSGLPLR